MTECTHHWIIESPHDYPERGLNGICKHCHAPRVFSQKLEDVRYPDKAAQLGYPRYHAPHTRLPFALADER